MIDIKNSITSNRDVRLCLHTVPVSLFTIQMAFEMLTVHEASKTIITRFGRARLENRIPKLYQNVVGHAAKDMLTKYKDTKEIVFMTANEGPIPSRRDNILMDAFVSSLLHGLVQKIKIPFKG